MTRSIMILLLVITLVPYASAENLGEDRHKVMEWGQVVQEALEKNSLRLLEINASTMKINPARIIRVQQSHNNQQEIFDILNSAATILKEGDFEIINQYNRAKTTASFRIELPDVCIGIAGRFVISSTGSSMFYIGCTKRDEKADIQSQFLRIRSEKLYKVLLPNFPKEILEQSE